MNVFTNPQDLLVNIFQYFVLHQPIPETLHLKHSACYSLSHLSLLSVSSGRPQTQGELSDLGEPKETKNEKQNEGQNSQ